MQDHNLLKLHVTTFPRVLGIHFECKTKGRQIKLQGCTRLTVLSKRLGRKRCCDTTTDRCLEVCHLTIFSSHCKKMRRLLPKIEGFGGIPGPEAYQLKNKYTQRRRLRRINSLPKVKFLLSDLSAPSTTKPQRI